MTDNIATFSGYTREMVAEHMADGKTRFLLVKPNADLETVFKAWDTDKQEFVFVKGWLHYVRDNKD